MSSLELGCTVTRLTFVLLLLLANLAFADPSAVNHRGLIALPAEGGGVYLSWRLFDTDPLDVGFDLYRSEAGESVRLNAKPLLTTTDFVDRDGRLDDAVDYFVGVAGTDLLSAAALKPQRPDESFLQFATGRKTHGRNLAVGDLLGRGQLDFVLRHSGVTVDPYYSLWRSSQSTYKLTAFDQTGAQLWEYDMGWAIEQGMWYSPFLVYDLDGDGRAELIVKAGDETMGKAAMRDRSGRVLYGAEYVRVIDGRDGKTVLAQANWPNRQGYAGADPANTPLLEREYENYNRYSRNFLAVAYLDGVKPYLIVSRGTYDKHKVVAYEYRKGKLSEAWSWENRAPRDGGEISHWGQGAHTLYANDVDGDGRDEIVLGALVLDDDGSVLYSIGHRHTEHLDHVYVGDIDPSRPGKELYYGAEWGHDSKGIGMHDAATGALIWAIEWPTKHIHDQGMCADIDAASPGLECYSGEENRSAHWLFSAKGAVLSEERFPSLGPTTAWWDADVQKELLESGKDLGDDVLFALSNYPERDRRYHLLSPADVPVAERHHLRVIAVLDLFGDWREEMIVADRSRMLVYSTTVPADRRLPWLMTDHSYKMGVVSSSVGYYQQPMLDMSLAKRSIPKQPRPFPAPIGAATPAESVTPSRDDAPAAGSGAAAGDPPVGSEVPAADVAAPQPGSKAPVNSFIPVGGQPAEVPAQVVVTPVDAGSPSPATSADGAETPVPSADHEVAPVGPEAAANNNGGRKKSRSGGVGEWSLVMLLLLLRLPRAFGGACSGRGGGANGYRAS